MELNKHEFPPGGWQYYQPQTGWRVASPLSSTHAQTCILIQQMRKKNPAITAKHNLATDLEAISIELMMYTRKRLGLPLEAAGLPFPGSHSNQSGGGAGAVAGRIRFAQPANPVPVDRGMVENLKRAAQGTAVVLDWLGSGGEPVSQELAEKRAAICVACPNNQTGSWYTESPAELIGEAIKAWQKLKGRTFSFETSQGDKLKSCSTCRCLMRLKVFCGMDHIVSKTPPNIMAEFPPACWIARRDA